MIIYEEEVKQRNGYYYINLKYYKGGMGSDCAHTQFLRPWEFRRDGLMYSGKRRYLVITA